MLSINKLENRNWKFESGKRKVGKRKIGNITRQFSIFNFQFSLITSLLLLTSIPSFGQQVTLDSVLALIRTNNPMLEEYDKRVQAMEANKGSMLTAVVSI